MKSHITTFLVLLVSVCIHGQIDHPIRSSAAGINPDWAPFYHGVASGDPLEDRVIIWTRVTPDTIGAGSVDVAWRIATDPELMEIVSTGSTSTDMSRDYTVKVDVDGLSAGTTYYYGFTYNGKNSLTGRTKTLPDGSDVQQLKFAVISCSNYQAGYFNAYQRIAERNDLDAVIHLGDYIYEYEQGGYGIDSFFTKRPLDPETEILSIEDYRTRYSLYRLDTMLARAHQQHPFITVWDDHESANDAWMGGAENHNEIISIDSLFNDENVFIGFDTTFADEGPWDERLSIAKQVYFEWLPIRDTEDEAVYRSFSYGNLVDLIMLDTRIEGREEQILNIYDPQLQSPDRTILGQQQKQWLKDQLATSDAKWKLIGQQVTFAPFNIGFAGPANGAPFEVAEALFLDFWDGYPAERAEIIDYINDNELDNVVILTGDVHTSFAYDIAKEPAILEFTTNDTTGLIETFQYLPSPTYDPATGEGSVAVEFVCPSISSANFDENLGDQGAAILDLVINSEFGGFGNPNPHMKYKELVEHGYYIIDITPEKAQADYFFGPIREVTGEEGFAQALLAEDGENHLVLETEQAPPKAIQDIPAPLNPPGTTTRSIDVPSDAQIMGLFPNPTSGNWTMQFTLNASSRLRVEVLDLHGHVVQVLADRDYPAGLHQISGDLSNYSNGPYAIQLSTRQGTQSAQLVIKN